MLLCPLTKILSSCRSVIIEWVFHVAFVLALQTWCSQVQNQHQHRSPSPWPVNEVTTPQQQLTQQTQQQQEAQSMQNQVNDECCFLTCYQLGWSSEDMYADAEWFFHLQMIMNINEETYMPSSAQNDHLADMTQQYYHSGGYCHYFWETCGYLARVDNY